MCATGSGRSTRMRPWLTPDAPWNVLVGQSRPSRVAERVGYGRVVPQQPQPTVASGRPDLAAEWSPANEFTADQVTLGSNRRVEWTCSACRHVWTSTVGNRVYRKAGCPHCARSSRPGPSIVETHPLLIVEWDRERNDLTPDQVSASSTERVWWRCPECDHSWQTQVVSRTSKGSKCPKCARARIQGRARRRSG
ncbi:hypothetical protein FNH13_17755 [Ornithinimicrobium ciconiae]|uniref:Treble clef zinc finger domain-containing protein n=1 Tax=Ornithinimicrobium ciconiae TaxID=2594265 RepID=A0A516GEK9_9MICO|nr:hypothetical protein FNH13_17755 [Ornithinimicrobium ciconiae]